MEKRFYSKELNLIGNHYLLVLYELERDGLAFHADSGFADQKNLNPGLILR